MTCRDNKSLAGQAMVRHYQRCVHMLLSKIKQHSLQGELAIGGL